MDKEKERIEELTSKASEKIGDILKKESKEERKKRLIINSIAARLVDFLIAKADEMALKDSISREQAVLSLCKKAKKELDCNMI